MEYCEDLEGRFCDGDHDDAAVGRLEELRLWSTFSMLSSTGPACDCRDRAAVSRTFRSKEMSVDGVEDIETA